MLRVTSEFSAHTQVSLFFGDGVGCTTWGASVFVGAKNIEYQNATKTLESFSTYDLYSNFYLWNTYRHLNASCRTRYSGLCCRWDLPEVTMRFSRSRWSCLRLVSFEAKTAL